MDLEKQKLEAILMIQDTQKIGTVTESRLFSDNGVTAVLGYAFNNFLINIFLI